ncbi:metal-binding protein [Pseudomonas sp. NPDC077186]|uniref:metal-binding protein n=1 Tax=Pseudomonas sp. NPDC077186 TaxID=3364421 RepID=UPI0037CB70DE
MGNYSKNISKRLQESRIEAGYCLICKQYGALSFDHVPPQGSITISKTEQLLITEVLNVEEVQIKGVISNNGSKFKTICKSCNGLLGRYDSEIARVCKLATEKISAHLSNVFSTHTHIFIEYDPVGYCRAMVGHVLSATTARECAYEPQATEYFSPLEKFVLVGDLAVQDTHDFYCWFYPYVRHVSGKQFAFMNDGYSSVMSCLYFFPIAFLIAKKGQGTFPVQAKKIEFSHKTLALDLSHANIKNSSFPFAGLEGNQILALSDSQITVSIPARKK